MLSVSWTHPSLMLQVISFPLVNEELIAPLFDDDLRGESLLWSSGSSETILLQDS
jgi:hypothetical protein